MPTKQPPPRKTTRVKRPSVTQPPRPKSWSNQDYYAESYRRDKAALIRNDLPFAVVVIGLLAFSNYVWPRLREEAVGLATSPVLAAGLVIVVVAVAYSLFCFRQAFQRTYGVLEIVFAGFTTWQVASRSNFNLSQLDFATLVGSCYIGVRGFTNWHDGATKLKQGAETSTR